MNLFSEAIEGMKISWDAIRANKLRSGLTTLGIVIGIVTVTLMGTAIEGLSRAFTKGISALSTDVMYVERYSWFSDDPWWVSRNRREITLAHAKALEKQLTDVRAVAPVKFGQQDVKYQLRSGGSVRIIGTSEQYLETSGISIAQGRFLSASEVDGVRPVCVIGATVAEKFFPLESPLGKRIMVGPGSFEVVGVIEKRGSFLGMISLDNEIDIPIGQFLNQFERFGDMRIDVKANDVKLMGDVREELQGIMRKLRRLPPGVPDDFAVNQSDAFIAVFQRVGGTIASVGLFITGLSLFVGGIGIMNIMFVSVAERTKEIGIRKAIGAKRRTILLQFLIEAATICLLGGTLALLIAFPVTLAMNKFLPATMSFTVIGIALLVSILTGVISGFMPAYRAARMDPVDALRSE